MMANRNVQSGATAIMARVPREIDHLYGLTYVSAIAFFIPRVIWREKPRGAGAYVAGILYQNKSLGEMRAYRGTGYPAGGVGEAYWNFGLPGVVVVYLLFGCFHKWLALRLASKVYDPRFVTLYLLCVILLKDVSSIAIVDVLQVGILIFVADYFANLFGTRVRTPRRALPNAGLPGRPASRRGRDGSRNSGSSYA